MRHSLKNKKGSFGSAIIGAILLQATIIGIAVVTGVMEPSVKKEARFRTFHETKSQREKIEEIDREMAAFERTTASSNDFAREMRLSELQSEVEMISALSGSQASLNAMVLAKEGYFRGKLDSAIEGIQSTELVDTGSVDFMGTTLNAKKVVLVVDISSSVKSKVERSGRSMERIRQEVRTFIDQLGPNHLFGILQFSRKIDTFKPELVPATVAVKEEAGNWLESRFKVNGSSGKNWKGGDPDGIQLALQEAFAMDLELDEIILVSDGDFQRTTQSGGGKDVPWSELRAFTRSLQEGRPGRVKISFFGFYPPEDSREPIKGWVAENGEGRLKILTD